ncbi:hypothetical protein H1R20_g14956, partial [Candolleomyces eurysporus]
MPTDAAGAPVFIDFGRLLLIGLILALPLLVLQVRRVTRASTTENEASVQTDITTNEDIMMTSGLRSQLAATVGELQQAREELAVARAEAQSAKDLCTTSLSEAKHEYDTSALKAQERQAQDQETTAWLQKTVERMEVEAGLAVSQNHSLVKKCEEYKTSFTSIQKAFQQLLKDKEAFEMLLRDADETAAQHGKTISKLSARNAVLEASMVSKDERIAYLSVIGKILVGRVAQGEEILSKQREELAAKAKEADDWRDLFNLSGSPWPMAQQRMRKPNSSTPSLITILAESEQEIKGLRDRLSECHSQLAACTCSGPILMSNPAIGTEPRPRPSTCS